MAVKTRSFQLNFVTETHSIPIFVKLDLLTCFITQINPKFNLDFLVATAFEY